MAYAERIYFIHYPNTYNDAVRISLLEDNFSGSSTLVEAEMPCFELQYDQEPKINAPFLPSALTAYFRLDNQTIIDDLIAAQEEDFKLRMTIGSTIVWEGFVRTGLLQIREGALPQTVGVTASDGLSLMSDKQFSLTVPASELLDDLLNNLLGSYSLAFDRGAIGSGWDSFELRQAGDSGKTIFELAHVNRSLFYDGSEEDKQPVSQRFFLDHVMRRFNARLFYWGGWKIESLDAEKSWESVITAQPNDFGSDLTISYLPSVKRSKLSYKHQAGRNLFGLERPEDYTGSFSKTINYSVQGNETLFIVNGYNKAQQSDFGVDPYVTSDICYFDVTLTNGTNYWDNTRRRWVTNVYSNRVNIGDLPSGAPSTLPVYGRFAFQVTNIPFSTSTLTLTISPISRDGKSNATAGVVYYQSAINVPELVEGETKVTYGFSSNTDTVQEDLGIVYLGDALDVQTTNAITRLGGTATTQWTNNIHSTPEPITNLNLRTSLGYQNGVRKMLRGTLYNSAYNPSRLLSYEGKTYRWIGGEFTGEGGWTGTWVEYNFVDASPSFSEFAEDFSDFEPLDYEVPFNDNFNDLFKIADIDGAVPSGLTTSVPIANLDLAFPIRAGSSLTLTQSANTSNFDTVRLSAPLNTADTSISIFSQSLTHSYTSADYIVPEQVTPIDIVATVGAGGATGTVTSIPVAGVSLQDRVRYKNSVYLINKNDISLFDRVTLTSDFLNSDTSISVSSKTLTNSYAEGDYIVINGEGLSYSIGDLADEIGTSSGNNVIRSDTEPTERVGGDPLVQGDIWIETDEGDRSYSWDGSVWVAMFTEIDGGNITTGTISAARLDVSGIISAGNILVTSSNISSLINNVGYQTSSDVDTAINNDTNKTFRQTNAPITGIKAGDIWIDTDDGDKPYTYNGSSWVAAYTSIDGGNITTGTVSANRIDVSGVITAGNLIVTGDNISNLTNNLNFTDFDATDVQAAIDTNVTVISGSKITTGTIDAGLVNVTNIDAANITVGQIQAGQIATDAVTADKINITSTLALSTGGAIQSTSYTAGSAGFLIQANGNAEFNDVMVRGGINTTSASDIDWQYVTSVAIVDADIVNLSANKITSGTIASEVITLDTGGVIRGSAANSFELSANGLSNKEAGATSGVFFGKSGVSGLNSFDGLYINADTYIGGEYQDPAIQYAALRFADGSARVLSFNSNDNSFDITGASITSGSITDATITNASITTDSTILLSNVAGNDFSNYGYDSCWVKGTIRGEFRSSDGSAGITGTAGNVTIKDGIVTAISASGGSEYTGWNLRTNGTNRGIISNEEAVNFQAGTNVTLGYSSTNNTITINATDTNTDTNNYANSLAFNTGTGVLTLGRLGLGALTVDLDGRYAQGTFDNYASWSIGDDGATNTNTIGSGDTLVIEGGTNCSTSLVGNTLTINATDTNTTYTAGSGLSLTGTVFSLNSGLDNLTDTNIQTPSTGEFLKWNGSDWQNSDIGTGDVQGLPSFGTLTNSRVVVVDATGDIVSSGTPATQLAYLNGVTSAIQTQLNAKGTMSRFYLQSGAEQGEEITNNEGIGFLAGSGLSVSRTGATITYSTNGFTGTRSWFDQALNEHTVNISNGIITSWTVS